MAVLDKESALITNDGFFDPGDQPFIDRHPKFQVPTLAGHLRVNLRNDYEVALANQMLGPDLLDINGGRSGHSQFGMTIVSRSGDVDIDSQRRMTIPAELISLRGAQQRSDVDHDTVLSTLLDLVTNDSRGVRVGRLALVNKDQSLNKIELLESIQRDRLLFTDSVNPDNDISDDGVVRIGLEELHFLFCEANFDDREAQRKAIISGKHGLTGIVEKQLGRPEKIEGGEFFLGGIKLSIGPYIGIIEPETNDPEVLHLAARLLDGVRTTGIDVVRQVELFNTKLASVMIGDLKVKIRFYHASCEVQDLWENVGSKPTIVNGVSFADVLQITDHPEHLMRILKQVGPTRKDFGPHGILVGNQKLSEVCWQKTPAQQKRFLTRRNERFDASDSDVCVRGKLVPRYARSVSEVIAHVGREQNEGRLHASWAFPETDVMNDMLKAGTGVFVAHDLDIQGDAYSAAAPMLGDDRLVSKIEHGPELFTDNRIRFDESTAEQFRTLHESGSRLVTVQDPIQDLETGEEIKSGEHLICNDDGVWIRQSAKQDEGDRYPRNRVYFDGTRFAEFQKLYEKGARLIMVRHPIKDQTNGNTIMPGEILQWDKHGFWVRPADQEKIDDVDTIITMYGSHVAGMDTVLDEQIERFAKRMKTRFGSSLAFMHGKGPGVMLIADQVAARNDIVSIGVGIDAERFNQSPNFHPTGQADFNTNDRLIRQKHMNDRATFNIFNIGGAGTLEEVALTLCSHKLHKNLLTPLIFVDPVGCGKGGRNLFALLKETITDMATKKQFQLGDDESSTGVLNVQLLASGMAGFIHIVDSYDSAADIIEEFADDPVAYYQHEDRDIPYDSIADSFAEATHNMQKTHFNAPEFMNAATVLLDPKWPENTVSGDEEADSESSGD
ncbi:MAG: LOG family protein [bacterium]|nr:LOG family protein [bacterium]